MTEEPVLRQHDHAVIQMAQYLASLTTHQDVWGEVAMALVNFFGADLVALGERQPDGEISVYQWTFGKPDSGETASGQFEKFERSPCVRTGVFAEMEEAIAGTLDSGFLTTRVVPGHEPLALVFLPVSQENRVTSILIIGHRTSVPFSRGLLNAYLAVAGLAGTTTARLASVRELRKHRQHLEELVSERTAALIASKEKLEAEITQRQLAEEALLRERDNLIRIFEAMEDPIYIVAPSCEIQYVNPAFEKHFSPYEGRKCYEQLDNRRSVCSWCNLEEVSAGQTMRCEWYCRGNEKTYDLIEAPLKNADGSIFMLTIFRDITERKRAEDDRLRLERELRHAQKAESLGRMAGAIAHLFNNHLAVVLGCLELLEDDLKPDANGFDNLMEAQKAARRAAETSALMLTFLGHDIAKKEPVNLAEVCRETLSSLNVPLAENTRITTGFPAHGPMTRANAAQMKQVLKNLVVNAQEALIDGKGDIAVTIAVIPVADIHAPRIYPAGWQPRDAAYACLSVADTGCGMNPETLDRIFDPFFSTRFTGRGLGLPVVLGIVKAHGGAVFVESRPGAGASVHVLLPLADELPPVTAPRPVGGPAAPVAGRGSVLVVDDEPAVRNMAQGMLRRLGFEALLASNGANAVEIFRQRPREIRCVLCDLTMPGMNGWETLSALREIRADIPVVLCSGYEEAAVMADTWTDRPQAFLDKPYGMKTLSESLDRALG